MLELKIYDIDALLFMQTAYHIQKKNQSAKKLELFSSWLVNPVEKKNGGKP